MEYKYKGKVYSKGNMNELINDMDSSNSIDKVGDNLYRIRGLDGSFKVDKPDELEALLETLVKYTFISNDRLGKKIQEQEEMEKSLKGNIKEEKYEPKKPSFSIDDHYADMRYKGFTSGRRPIIY